MLSRIRRHGRMWGALVLSSGGVELSWNVRRAFSTIGVAATQLVERISEQRVRAVRARIDHKILEQIQPKHLFYQILHGMPLADRLRPLGGAADLRQRIALAGGRRRAGRLAEGQGPERGPQALAGATAARPPRASRRLRVQPRRQGLGDWTESRRDRPGRAARLRPRPAHRRHNHGRGGASSALVGHAARPAGHAQGRLDASRLVLPSTRST